MRASAGTAQTIRVHVCECGHAEPRDGAPAICSACGAVARLRRHAAGATGPERWGDGRPRELADPSDPSRGARILPIRGAE